VYLVIDIEATCWEKKIDADKQSEIIEIGCCIVQKRNGLMRLDEKFGWFVCPVLHPTLSVFCKKLTSIKQSDIDSADMFPTVIEKLREKVFRETKLELNKIPFFSWGDYDRKQFYKDCLLHDIKYPFGPHVNIKQKFADARREKGISLLKALGKLGKPFEGIQHRGEDDAYNIAKIVVAQFGYNWESILPKGIQKYDIRL